MAVWIFLPTTAHNRGVLSYGVYIIGNTVTPFLGPPSYYPFILPTLRSSGGRIMSRDRTPLFRLSTQLLREFAFVICRFRLCRFVQQSVPIVRSEFVVEQGGAPVRVRSKMVCSVSAAIPALTIQSYPFELSTVFSNARHNV